MDSISRKNILKAAKDGIKKEIVEKLDQIKSELEKEWQKELDDRDSKKIDLLLDESSKLTEEYNSFGKSKRAKKKAAIQWAENENGEKIEKPKKPHREVKDWNAIHQIRSNHVNSRPRASAWLQEGCMVVRRNSSMPMMVLSIRRNGTVECLVGGSTQYFRDVALRPAFDDE